jgi:hypothetical protein
MSDYDTYSRIHCRSVYTSEDGLRLANNDDVTKTVTIKCTPSASGNIDLQLPTSAGTLLNTASDLDARNLANLGNLVAVTPDNLDGFLICDDSDSAKPKRVTGTALKAYIGSVALPSATEAQMLVANSSGVYSSVSLSGDATVNASGALTLANDSVGSAQIEANAVTAGKLNINGATALSGSVVGADEVLLYDASTTSNVKVPMSGIATYVSANLTNASVATAKVADSAITTAKLADDCVTSAKLAPAVALDTSVEAPIVYIGNNKWKMELSTNDLVFSYWNGSAWVVGQTIGAP